MYITCNYFWAVVFQIPCIYEGNFMYPLFTTICQWVGIN